jgi:two-component system, sensor histidine kinase and response regulator
MAKILLVEDDPDMLSVLHDTLVIDNHQVIEARHGEQALAALETTLPGVIITDLRMPYMDGIELIRRVRANPDWSAIKIIVVSGIPTDEQSALDAGADAFLLKPFSHVEMAEILAEVE